MTKAFDDLARAMATGISRRQALWRFAVGTASAAVAGLLPGSASADDDEGEDDGNDACAHFCNQLFPPGRARGQCKSEAAHGRGPCFTCGPEASRGHPQPCRQGTAHAVCCPANAPVCCGGVCCPSTADLTLNGGRKVCLSVNINRAVL